MSGASTPVGGGGYMRQRHTSSGGERLEDDGDDMEDDASSRPPPPTMIHRAQTWTQVLENTLWIASAAFIVYLGDRHSNMIYLLCWDHRIKRMPLYLGLVGVLLNIVVIFYGTVLTRCTKKSYEKYELWPSSAPLMTLLGSLSFCLFSFALWPVWSFFIIPLLFTLLMAVVVISPYLPIKPLRPRAFLLHADQVLPL